MGTASISAFDPIPVNFAVMHNSILSQPYGICGAACVSGRRKDSAWPLEPTQLGSFAFDGLSRLQRLRAMDADEAVAASLDHEALGENVISTEVLIIGFGFSAIPLLRELERDGIDHLVVSAGDGSIWDKLERHGRLDFDMVSSMHTSLYSFELVQRDAKDRYLPSAEYAAFIKKYLDRHSARLVDDWVTSIENHAQHSIVRTQSGRTFCAKHVVVATAFRRRMNQLLNEFDYACARNQTIAITAMGDSVNLMISKLVPYGNRIILVTNGFMLLDKLSFYGGRSYTLDQFEYHNLRYLSFNVYRKTFLHGLDFVWLCQKLFRFLSIDQLYFKHPLAVRRFRLKFDPRWLLFPPSPVPNGIIAIKYWPIDAYQQLFDNDSLKPSIGEGYLLNDIAFFLEQGLVELWPKRETIIDRARRTIEWNGKVIKCDHILDADYERPNLPAITGHRAGAPPHKYEYVYRNSFMGVIPKELRNVYFLGYTRPMTGGLNNIVEMQCLFTHKLIADPAFHSEIHQNLEERIEQYNRKYYYLSTGRTDHLVPYGFYTDDIARVMRINPRVSECRSIRDVVTYFLFPNAAYKYRQSGPYAVPGVKEMVRKVYDDHKGFSLIGNYVVSYALLQLTAYAVLALAYYHGELPGIALPFLFLIVLWNPITPFVAINAFGLNSYLNLLMLAGLVVTACFMNTLIPIASIIAACALTYAFRRLGWTRVLFNDLKNKRQPKYREFFGRYCDAFREVFGQRAVAGRPSTVSRDGAYSSAKAAPAAASD
jgi:hypothetical protein